MLNSFFTALSGLNANSQSLSVIGNNLANMNTVGYKSNIISFQDMVARTVLSFNGAGNPEQIGLGVETAGISKNFLQGVLQTTSQNTDLAIVGGGFFVVRDDTSQLYTRAGNFTLDSEGYLVTQDGFRVQGYQAVNGAIDSAAGLSDIDVDPGVVLQAIQTSEVRFVTNLNGEMPPGDTYSTSATVVDGLGSEHTVNVTYTRNTTAPGTPPEFGFDVVVEGGDVVGGTAGTPFSLLTGADATTPPPGTMTFDATGRLASVDSGSGAVTPATDFAFTTPAFMNGAAAQTVNFDVLDELTGDARITAFSGPSTTSSTYQDGASAASLFTFSVDQSGVVQGVFSNGKTAPLGQLALATFNNNQGLVRTGSNAFRAGPNSGEPSIGVAESGGRGSISGGALELSNVDIADEFTKLIIAQRGYQANSRVITTTDEVFQEAINLKR